MRGFTVADYAYACTRVRVRKRFLIKSEEYARLAAMDLASVARFIGESQYKNEIERLSSEFQGPELIEMATYMNLATTYKEVTRYCKGEARDILECYLNEIDLKNLKTVLRGKFHGASGDELRRNLIPGGRFIERLGDSLISAAGPQEVVEVLTGTMYHGPLVRALERDPEIKTLRHLEDALDLAYYAYLLDSLKGSGTSTKLFKDFINREIDMRNLITLLQVKMGEEREHLDLNPKEMFIPSGREMSMEALSDLYSASDMKHLLGMLEKYSFYVAIQPYFEKALRTGSLNELVNAIERAHLSKVARFASRYPLSILPIVHFLILKKGEVDNLRIIARGKERGLEPETIRGLVIT
jgi:V/A-type H+-transporting ATPase subunit C